MITIAYYWYKFIIWIYDQRFEESLKSMNGKQYSDYRSWEYILEKLDYLRKY